MVETASESGSAANTAGWSQSITTEVSISPSGMGEALVDGVVEIAAEGGRVDGWAGCNDGGEVGLGDEPAPAAGERAKLGDGGAVARDDEGGAGLDGGDDLGVLVAELALGDDAGHGRSVAQKATVRYRRTAKLLARSISWVSGNRGGGGVGRGRYWIRRRGRGGARRSRRGRGRRRWRGGGRRPRRRARWSSGGLWW